LREAHQLANVDPESGPRIQARLDELQRTLNRNEQAALAFVLIDRLLQTA